MKKQDLIELGIAEDVAEKIFALHGKDITKHQTAAETAKAEADTLKAQLAEASKQIEGFKGLDIEGVKKAADDWKAKAEQAQKEAAEQIAQVKFDHALESALSGAKAKNVKAVQALLNKDGLKLNDDGTIIGLNEQLEKIKSENDYLFADAKPIPEVVLGGHSKSVLGDAMADAARKAAGLVSPKT